VTGYGGIADHFRRQIADGELAPGDRLPPLREVMAEFQVAAQTASRAYNQLKAEGLTEARRGGGTVVADSGSTNIDARVRNWVATGRALSSGETSKIIGLGIVAADESIANRLEVEPGSQVFMRRRVVSRNDAPVHLTTSFYPLDVIEATPELTEPVSTGSSRELAAERLGAKQDQVLEEVTSRAATEDEKEQLGLTGQFAVTQVMRTVWLTNGKIIEVAVKVCTGATVLKWSTRLS
jgi:DNA-binding GntR family transcriptional regulator